MSEESKSDQKQTEAAPETDSQLEGLKAQVAELEGKLAAARAEAEMEAHDLHGQLDDAEKALGEKDAQIAGLKNDCAELLKQFNSANEMLSDSVDRLAKAGVSCDGNHVFLDGEKYDIIWRSTVKDLSIEGYQKRNVDEGHTAIVIAKHGG